MSVFEQAKKRSVRFSERITCYFTSRGDNVQRVPKTSRETLRNAGDPEEFIDICSHLLIGGYESGKKVLRQKANTVNAREMDTILKKWLHRAFPELEKIASEIS